MASDVTLDKRRSALVDPRPSQPSGFAIACLGAALVASAAMLLYVGRAQVIRDDAMFYAFRLAHDPFAEAAFTSPLNLYLIALPLALYRGMFEAFGLGADLPYRLVSTAPSSRAAFSSPRSRAAGSGTWPQSCPRL